MPAVRLFALLRARSALTRAAAGALAAIGLVFNLSAFDASAALANDKDAGTCSGRDILADVQAQDPASFTKIMTEAQATANDGAALWRVERDGKPDSYLFGTIHLTDERITELSDAVKSAIGKSRVVALEVADISPVATMQAIGAASDLVLFDNGHRLDQVISSEAFSLVEKKLEEAKLPTAMAHMYKPWVVSMILAVGPCERERVAGGKLVLDMVVSAYAQEKKIPVVGLETLQSQLEAAAAVPMDEQVQILRASLVHASRADDLRETVLRLYLQRKLGAVIPLQLYVAAKSGEVTDNLDGFREALITNRNRTMRTRALPLLAEGGAFIAVGGLHLVGEEGLVKLLRDAGYRVVPVE
ncbi:GumN family protein [Candidatus Filomicrobium marinum]|uniref:GumN family protein n=2 Tax=Filomicrobium TaxID=119044 RepID=A0A0D6JDJ9_9HYPH|nr:MULTISPECIES: TraB/GumN family protein [Filomicrobium]MCV0368431.1 TraB/GumN family protein [Filomicrobium sp.]CFX10703.1 GumN family protein [Candidatus Filomicrobium marinum]CPR17162.1 GumN family protein [Candidatus Filomicrobium marinum]SDO38771.1 hypothetical protein SAMN04488061_1059 [Filomicrobium insigne]